jgi:hypothetical protein
VPALPEIRLLDDATLSELLGVSVGTVWRRERGRKLFSYLLQGSERGRIYPSFQAWPSVTGAPLARLLAALGKYPSARDALFFAGANRELGGLTPVEVLAGALAVPRDLDTGALALLRAPADERLEAAVEAAKAWADAG